MVEIRTSLRVVDLPSRHGTYENIGTAYSEYEVHAALVSVVLEDEVERGTPRRALRDGSASAGIRWAG